MTITYQCQPDDKIEGLQELYADNQWTNYLVDWDKTLRAISASRTLIAVENSRVVGLVRGVTDGETILYLQDLLVHPNSQRRGIGRALLTKFLEKYSVDQTVLIAESTNEARQFYCALGLSPVPDDYGQAFILDRRFADL